MDTIINEFIKAGELYKELINKTEGTKRSYNNIELFPSEIHTLVFIKDNNDLNMTEVAKEYGVTKGAIFKIILKLEKKDLLKRYKKESNNKSTYFEVTEKGIQAYLGHEEFHEDFFSKPSDEMTTFTNNNKLILEKGLVFAQEYLKNHIRKLEDENVKD